MNLIVAVDSNWGIGYQDRLLFWIREDMKHFRALTLGKTIILGRRTLQTFPGGRPLDQRQNIVLTRSENFSAEPALICRSLKELRQVLADQNLKDVFVIGGASIYRQLLPYCRLAYVTQVAAEAEADCFFPDLDQDPKWERVTCEQHQTDCGQIIGQDEPSPLNYSFCIYHQPACKEFTDETPD